MVERSGGREPGEREKKRAREGESRKERRSRGTTAGFCQSNNQILSLISEHWETTKVA